MADIKTRDTVKGTIKTWIKLPLPVKNETGIYRHKDKAEHSVNTNENTAEEYAADKTEAGIDEIAHKGAYAFIKPAKRCSGNKEEYPICQRRHSTLQTAESRKINNVQRTQGRTTTVGSSSAQTQTSSAIKTLEKPEKMVKQSATSAGKKNIKLASKEAAKTTQRSVKTAEHTARQALRPVSRQQKLHRKPLRRRLRLHGKQLRQQRKRQKLQQIPSKATAKKLPLRQSKAIIAGTKALVAAIAAGGWIAVVIIMIVVLFGAAVAMFGGGSDSNSYTPVSAEVEAYEPIIQKYAKEYGIPEYVELIKAVMMQESGGRGLDPMQAAEGSFNTKYPHEPNGIKDPEYSIQCGVQELKAALTSAEVESPIDMERIKLALQGYNFGNGYISWAKSKYGGYSYANAVEFSTQQAQRLGWDSYGDTQYPAHVLRYYPYGRAFTAGSNQGIVEVALTQIGNEGGQPYWSWYGFDSRVEWCACFVSWCADQCGYIDSGLIPKFAGCIDGANWFKSNNRWNDRNYEPKAGDIIFFDWEDDGTTDHVGIVEKCENGTVYTVEGNSGDACRQRQYTVGSRNIYGYGIPAY